MNYLPQLMAGERQVLNTTVFGGYDHRDIIKDGEMYNTTNMGGEAYPLLSVRRKRAYTSWPESAGKLTGISGRDQLIFVLGDKVYYNYVPVSGITISTAEAMCPKKIVNFGAYVLIFPDKVYFNTVNQSDCGSIDRLWTESGTNISLQMCRGDGTNYDMTQITVSESAPANPTNGKLWIDQSGDKDVLRQWTQSTGEWVEVASTFVKISGIGIGTGLEMYDGISISGIAAPDGAAARIREQVAALNGSFITYFRGENYIVVAGLISQTMDSLKNQAVRVDRTIPEMDWIVESNNRLWGCKYGMVNGAVVNEIRCSALGTFKNWNRFLGNSQDSYVASVGSDGFFTGAVTQKSYPVFFKENCIHQVYGNTPSTFQINTTIARGIQEGSGRSAVVVNEQVYYKSRTDIMMFDGSMPIPVSAQLGAMLYRNARAGAIGGKYYISMQDINLNWHLFTYDTENGTWYREDDFQALGFGRVEDELFAIDEEGNRLAALRGSRGEIEADFNWMAEFGMYGTDYREQKYLSRFDLRMYMEEGSEAQLEIQYDSGVWEKMPVIRGRSLRSFVVPVIPRRCDHLRFRIAGKGEMRMYSISRVMEVGADG